MLEPAAESDQTEERYDPEISLEFVAVMSAALSSDEGSGRAEFRKSFDVSSTLPGHQELRKWLSEHGETDLPSSDVKPPQEIAISEHWLYFHLTT